MIDERELMGRLGLGRTPVREALRRLAQEQLVEVFPRRGSFVTGVDAVSTSALAEPRSAPVFPDSIAPDRGAGAIL